MVQLSASTIKAVANHSEAMEADTILKNGRSLKSQTSKRNLAIFVCLLFFGTLYAQEAKPRIAVVPLKCNDCCTSPAVFDLNKAFANTNQFTVIEKAAVAQVLDELGIQNNPSAINSNIAQIGNLLEADKIVVINVSQENRTRTTMFSVVEIEGNETLAVVETKQKVRRTLKNWRVAHVTNCSYSSKLSKSLIDDLLN